jgi:hypothetical protein
MGCTQNETIVSVTESAAFFDGHYETRNKAVV